MSSRQQECFPCPANSVSEEEGSVVCVCEEDHFRTPLDTPSAPCTSKEIMCLCVAASLTHSMTNFCIKREISFHVCEPIVIAPTRSASRLSALVLKDHFNLFLQSESFYTPPLFFSHSVASSSDLHPLSVSSVSPSILII